MTTPTLLALSVFHPELLPKNCPHTVLCLSPGLALPEEEIKQYWQAEAYPLAPKEAQQALQELLTFALGKTTLLRENKQENPPVNIRKAQFTVAQAEEESLSSFEQDGKLPAVNVVEKTKAEIYAEQRHKAQLTLLLAWNMEKEFLEIAAIAHRLRQSPLAEATAQAASTLQEGSDLLKDMEEDVQELAAIESHTAELSVKELMDASPKPDWRISLYAMAALLPANVALFAWQPEIGEVLHEKMRPLGANEAALLTPQWAAANKALYGEFPLWQILNLSKAPQASSNGIASSLLRTVPLLFLSQE